MVGSYPGLRLLSALLVMVVSLAAAANAQAQETPQAAPPPTKVQELIKLLDDPEIRGWLQTKSELGAADASLTTVE